MACSRRHRTWEKCVRASACTGYTWQKQALCLAQPRAYSWPMPGSTGAHTGSTLVRGWEGLGVSHNMHPWRLTAPEHLAEVETVETGSGRE